MTTETILNEIVTIGKFAAELANPGTYAADSVHWAKVYEPSLVATRNAYAAIKAGSDPVAILNALAAVITKGLKGAVEALAAKIVAARTPTVEIKVEEPVAVVEAVKTLETVTCGRCGGNGNYGPLCVFSGKCFKCCGVGKVYTKRGSVAKRYLEEIRSKRLADMVAGDKYLVAGFTAGSFRQAGYWVTVTAVEVTGETVVVHGKFSVRGYGEQVSRLEGKADRFERVAQTAEQKRETLARAIAYQETLTKAGTVRKAKGKRSKVAA